MGGRHDLSCSRRRVSGRRIRALNFSACMIDCCCSHLVIAEGHPDKPGLVVRVQLKQRL